MSASFNHHEGARGAREASLVMPLLSYKHLRVNCPAVTHTLAVMAASSDCSNGADVPKQISAKRLWERKVPLSGPINACIRYGSVSGFGSLFPELSVVHRMA